MFYGGMGGPGTGNYGHHHLSNETFDEQYHCFSGAFLDKPQLEEGDKVLLPSSAFEQLARLQIEYPMLFEVRSEKGRTHCGVMEFTAPEGNCIMPFWMMQNLLVEEGGLISVRNVSLPKASFVKFKPQSVDFLDISNPRAVLERQLRTFSCVTVGDQICLPYNDKRYYLEVQEVRPSEAACIIETDCNVDFDAPVGYSEQRAVGGSTTSNGQNNGAASNDGGSGASGSSSSRAGVDAPAPLKARRTEASSENGPTFKAFAGSGQRLDGKQLKDAQAARLEAMPARPEGTDGASGGNAAAAAVPGFASAGRTASGNAGKHEPSVQPKKPAPKFKPPASKWSKTNRAAFSGSGNSLK